MRADQYDKLKLRSEELADVVIAEVDPSKWPGDGQELGTLSREDRGDRYWCKKNAAATLTLLTKIQSIVDIVERRKSDPRTPEPEDDGDLDREIAAAESEAADIIERLQSRKR
jgi:hypothetical protein